jgi:hypothetical protein
MQVAEGRRAAAAATATATMLGLTVDNALVLHDSNKLTLRLLPADVVARVAPGHEQNAAFEIALAQRLAKIGAPVGALEPRVGPFVHELDGFVITLWRYYPARSVALTPAAYADGLHRLHAGMRKVDTPAPDFTDRVQSALGLVANPDRTPDLGRGDRILLRDTLTTLGDAIVERGGGQLLHGEPHPGNVLNTGDGPVFIDLETCCRGPVEFDLAHAPDAVSDHYPGIDQGLLRQCRILKLAMITTWRWDRDDLFPGGQRLAVEWLGQLREAVASGDVEDGAADRQRGLR